MQRNSSEVKIGTLVQWVYTNSDEEIVQRKVGIVVPWTAGDLIEHLGKDWANVLLTEGHTEFFPMQHPNFTILSEASHHGN